MQIHELTQPKNTPLEEVTLPSEWVAQKAKGVGNAVAKQFNNPTVGSNIVKGIGGAAGAVSDTFKDISGGITQAKQDRKVQQLADKSYGVWKNYEAQLLKADPDARETGQLEKQLLAFVNKNLLGGMYLPNVINKDKIISLVNQISNSGKSAPTVGAKATTKPAATNAAALPKSTMGTKPVGATPVKGAKPVAGANAFGQMATQLGSKAAPQNTMANAPVSKTNVAKPSNPNQPQQTPLQQATALQQQVKGQKPATTFGKVPLATSRATPGQMPAGVANSPQGKKMQKVLGKPRGGIQGMTSDLEEAIPTVKPIVRPVGGLAARSAQRNAPATPAATTTPAPAATPVKPVAPAATTTPAPAATPAQAPAAQPAASGNEKELFKQLVQQAALAQTSAPGAGAGTAGQPNAKAGKGQAGGAQDARGMAQALRQQLDPAMVKSLSALGTTANQLTGSRQVSSTGNPAADGLLVLMGFQGL